MADRQWSGKTGGGSFGQKFLFGTLKRVRVSFLYPVLYVVTPFYWLFGKQGRKTTMAYFQHRLGQSKLQAICSSLQNHLIFGKIVLDKFALLAGNVKQFKVTVDNVEIFNKAIEQPNGFFVVSAHVGNFELAGHCLKQDKKNLNGIIYGGEGEAMKQRRADAFKKSRLNLIPVTNDMSHLFAIKEAIDNGEIVTIPCDRLFGSPKSYTCSLLNQETQFPIGTFRLAAQLDAPVFVIFIMKEKHLHYHGFVKQLTPLENEKASIKKAEHLGKQYVAELETILKHYPEQWFNYYDFWNDLG